MILHYWQDRRLCEESKMILQNEVYLEISVGREQSSFHQRVLMLGFLRAGGPRRVHRPAGTTLTLAVGLECTSMVRL